MPSARIFLKTDLVVGASAACRHKYNSDTAHTGNLRLHVLCTRFEKKQNAFFYNK